MCRLEWSWMRTKKLDFLRTLGRSKSICLYRCAKKGKFMLCVPKMQIVLVPIQRKIKFNMRPTEPSGTESGLDFAPKHFNLVPSFPGYEIAQRLIFHWCFYSGFAFWGARSLSQPYLLNVGNRQDDNRYFWRWFSLSKACLSQILEPPKLPIL